MVLDYYAYWNGTQIRDLFEALVAITSGASYMGLIKSAVLAGLLITLTSAVLRWQHLNAKIYILCCALFYSVLLIPKVDLSIHDERAGTVHVVQNVPFGAGFFAATSSKVGHYLTEAFEGAFSLPESERFSKFGMVYPQRAISALLAAGPVTPEGKSLLSRTIADCIAPELMDHPEKVSQITHSNDLWATITSEGWVNAARSTVTPSGEVKHCPAALADLDRYLNDQELSVLKKRLGSILAPDHVDPSSVIARTLPQSEALLLGLSRSLEASLKHSIMLTALPEGMASIARQAGAPLDLATKYATSQANLASEVNYRTLSLLAQNSLPKIRNCVEFIVIAAFPLMLVLILAAGSNAGVIVRCFCVLVLWFQLWAPLYAVANYLMITVDANPMNRIIAEFGGSTLLAASIIREAGASSQAIAGVIMMLIPVIAFALAKGSDMAFVSMAGGLLSPATASAGASSSQAASGNLSAGNLSMGNTTRNTDNANKSDQSASWSDPYTSRTNTAYGSVIRDGSGTVTGMQRTSIDIGVQSTGTLTSSRTSMSGMMSSTTLSRGEQSALSMASSSTSSDVSTQEFARALAGGVSSSTGVGTSSLQATGVSESVSASSSASASSALSNGEGFEIKSGLGLKAAAGGAKGAANSAVGGARGVANGVIDGIGAATGFDAKTTQQLIDTATRSDSAISSRERTDAYRKLISASDSIAASTTDMGVKRAAENFSQALQKAYQLAQNQSVGLAKTVSGYSGTNDSLSGADTTSVNNDVYLMRTLLSSGQSAEGQLQRMFESPEIRDQLGARATVEGQIRGETGQAIGPGQIAPASANQEAIAKRAQMLQAQLQAEGSNHVGKKADRKNVFANASPLASEEEVRETASQIHGDHAREIGQKQSGVDSQHRDVGSNVDRYQREEKGAGTVFSNAFLGGLGYKGPTENGMK